MVIIALKHSNTELEKALVRMGPAPHRCLYNIEKSSLLGMLNIDLLTPLESLAESVRHCWVLPDWQMLIKAASSAVAAPGIELFEAIHSTGFDFSPYSGLLDSAASRSEPAMVKYLLELLKMEKPLGSAVVQAVEFRKTGVREMLACLLSHGVEVDWMSTAPCGGWGDPICRAEAEVQTPPRAGQETALHIVSQRGEIDLVKLLLDHGAKIDIKDTLGRTAYDRAKLLNQSEVMALLKARERKVYAMAALGLT